MGPLWLCSNPPEDNNLCGWDLCGCRVPALLLHHAHTVNMPDLIRKQFGYGRYGQHAARIGLGHTCRIQPPILPKKAWIMILLCKTGLGGLVRFGPNASGPEGSWCARIIRCSFWQNPISLLPVSHFQSRLHSSTDGADHTVQNQTSSNLVLADYL